MCYVSRKNPLLRVFTNSWPSGLQSLTVSAQIYSFHRRRVWFKVTELDLQLNLVFELSARCYFYYITWPLYETQLFCQGLNKWEGLGSENTAPGELLHALESHWGELHRTTQNVLVTLYSAGRLRGDLESRLRQAPGWCRCYRCRDWLLGAARVLTARGVT